MNGLERVVRFVLLEGLLITSESRLLGLALPSSSGIKCWYRGRRVATGNRLHAWLLFAAEETIKNPSAAEAQERAARQGS
jgi:hypothetical protein